MYMKCDYFLSFQSEPVGHLIAVNYGCLEDWSVLLDHGRLSCCQMIEIE